jgi:phosphate starvation-inducible membrane PsiE
MMDDKTTVAPRPDTVEQGLEQRAVRALVRAEHLTFILIGALLFAVGLVVLFRSTATFNRLLTVPLSQVIPTGYTLLDSILFVLILVELAYTVVLSLRGAELSAEPFLIVGLIAVIRRNLVITVGEGDRTPAVGLVVSGVVELLVLMIVVIAFVFAIWLLRRIQPRAANSRRTTPLACDEHQRPLIPSTILSSAPNVLGGG